MNEDFNAVKEALRSKIAIGGILSIIVMISIAFAMSGDENKQDSQTINEYKEKQAEIEEAKQKELALNLVKQYPPDHTFMNIEDYLHLAYVVDELPEGEWLILPANYVKEGAYTVDYVTSKFQFNFAVDVETGEVIGKDKKDRLFMEYIRDLNQGGNYSEEILGDLDREINW